MIHSIISLFVALPMTLPLVWLSFPFLSFPFLSFPIVLHISIVPRSFYYTWRMSKEVYVCWLTFWQLESWKVSLDLTLIKVSRLAKNYINQFTCSVLTYRDLKGSWRGTNENRKLNINAFLPTILIYSIDLYVFLK